MAQPSQLQMLNDRLSMLRAKHLGIGREIAETEAAIVRLSREVLARFEDVEHLTDEQVQARLEAMEGRTKGRDGT